uniref:Reverse transcriptase zinc-binding domain-containing protein n=1 Tax=Hordeum vulgare subsp. vulgare TaxID=112509 RepID=A0A8I7B309_HORVV
MASTPPIRPTQPLFLVPQLAPCTWKLTWRDWALPRVLFFHWLTHLDRCWTVDRLARRGLQHPARCPLCDQALEAMHHLILTCPFARQIWHEALCWLWIPCSPPNYEPLLHDWWHSARQSPPRPMDDMETLQ